jgi:hypothetical protein
MNRTVARIIRFDVSFSAMKKPVPSPPPAVIAIFGLMLLGLIGWLATKLIPLFAK